MGSADAEERGRRGFTWVLGCLYGPKARMLEWQEAGARQAVDLGANIWE